jgi:hypothetical protein
MGLNPRLLSLVSPPMRLLRGLSGRVLPCGCLVGVYETYSGGVVATIDARGATCTQPGHRLHDAVDLSQLGVALHSTPRDQSTRL